MAVLSAIKAGVNLAKNASGLAPKAKALFKKRAAKAEMWRVQMIRAERQMKRAKSPFAKKRARKRFIRYREKWHLEKLRQALIAEGVATSGPLLDGTALEIRRNMLVNEWDGASPEGRADIEKLIGSYDKKTDELYKQWSAIDPAAAAPSEPPAGSSARLGLGPIPKPPPEDPEASPKDDPAYAPPVTLHPGQIRAKNLRVNERQALVTGLGGLGFTSTAPPGSGRLVRVAFYPAQASQTFSGANGIFEPGDDPVLVMRLTATAPTDFVLSSDHVVQTELLDYGKYRMLGLQCNYQGNLVVRQADGTLRTTSRVQGSAIGIRSLEIYNGEKLLLPLGDMDAATINLFGSETGGYDGIAAGSLTSFKQQAPYNFQARSKAFFMGLRMNPIIEGTGRLRMVVRSFVSVVANPGPADFGFEDAGDYVDIPISFNVIGDMVEDGVMGNPAVPSPASRAGAQVRLALKDLGQDSDGQQRLQLLNPRYRPPESEDPGTS